MVWGRSVGHPDLLGMLRTCALYVMNFVYRAPTAGRV